MFGKRGVIVELRMLFSKEPVALRTIFTVIPQHDAFENLVYMFDRDNSFWRIRSVGGRRRVHNAVILIQGAFLSIKMAWSDW